MVRSDIISLLLATETTVINLHINRISNGFYQRTILSQILVRRCLTLRSMNVYLTTE